MPDVTYIIKVPSERLSGLSGKTSYDATGNLISPEEAIKDPLSDAAKRKAVKNRDDKHAGDGEDDGAPGSSEEDHDSSDMDDEDEEAPTDDGLSDRDGMDEFEEFEWLKSMYGEATIPDDTSKKNSKRIANCIAKLIHRRQIQASFYADMEEPTRDTSALAYDLFDRYGCLKREFREHPVKKGSGVWGKELDAGDFLLIELITVEKDHQRQGIATKLANTVWEKAQTMGCSVPFAFVWATHYNTTQYRIETARLSDNERKASFNRSQARAVAFWRSLGYRRVGSTQWFCLATDSNHPSRKLAVNDDYDPPIDDFTTEDGRDLKDIYPVHYSIDHSNDADAVSFLEQRLLSFPATDASWRTVDREGKSLLHYAAECSKPHTLRWILERPFGVELLSCRNHAGETPLEALETVLEADRVKVRVQMMILPVSDQFSGFDKESIACLIMLKGISNPSDLDVARVAYGCTCGECLGGFLSPRMTFALLCQAEVLHDQLNMDLGDLTGAEWCDWRDVYIQHMPPHVRANLVTNKSLRQGFTNLFNHVASCLRSKQIPRTEMVLQALDAASEWPPCTKNFLQRGGTVASVLLTVIEVAMDQDEMTGDGFHQEAFQDDIDKLKSCRNDNEWAFVRRQCGFGDDRGSLGTAMGMGAPEILGKRTREQGIEDGLYGMRKRTA